MSANLFASLAMLLPMRTAVATPPRVAINAVASGGSFLLQGADPGATTANATFFVESGTKLRFSVTGRSDNHSTVSVDFTVSQAGQTLATYGPPGGQLVGVRPQTRTVPFCVSNLRPPVDCSVLPMAEASNTRGAVTVVAEATGHNVASGRTEKTVVTAVYVPVESGNIGSADSVNLPPASGACGPSPGQIGLAPSYIFDNRTLRLKKVSFFFSAYYLGPNPDDPTCSTPPSGVSGTVTADVGSPGAGNEKIPPGLVAIYVGNIPALGRWRLTAYSPEVGLTVSCARSFGNTGGNHGNVSMNTNGVDFSPNTCY
jgi:hypothetical protein